MTLMLVLTMVAAAGAVRLYLSAERFGTLRLPLEALRFPLRPAASSGLLAAFNVGPREGIAAFAEATIFPRRPDPTSISDKLRWSRGAFQPARAPLERAPSENPLAPRRRMT